MQRFSSALLLAAAASFALAQDGVSTASSARTKYLGNLGLIPSSREIAVEDFVNYHRHELPRPRAGQSVAMDVRWSKDGRDAILQVGLSTTLATDRQQIRPLNIALVIDKSGSMAGNDKLERVKEALLTLVSELRETDTLALVAFDSEAEVVLPSHRLDDKEEVKQVIRNLRPGSATNLEAGLVLGYKEALKNVDRESTSRVILLTDGIANQGVVDPGQIAEESQGYNDRGIDLSTIGVGADLNKDLLRTLAKSGRGLFHFVADDEDIKKVFVKEMQSLVSPVATTPDLEITYGSGLRLDKVFGFEPKFGPNSIRIHLDTMNSGMTEVVLARFRPTGEGSVLASASLSFHDVIRDMDVTLRNGASWQASGEGAQTDPAVDKNYAIALLAQSIKDMAADCEEKRASAGLAHLEASINRTHARYPNLDDEDVRRNYDMAVKYRDILREQVPASERDQSPDTRYPIPETRSLNLIPNGDFSKGNTGFTAHSEYIKPSPNCLWGGYYTVSARFDSPFQLHTNVPAQPYAAPKGGQVLFMNTGSADLVTLWSAKVRCKAHTKYRISFQEIGLSGGPEWTNSYEIQVGRDKSDAQMGGTGQYAEVSYEWDSGSSTNVTVSIVRLPKAHIGGIIGIANITMVPVK